MTIPADSSSIEIERTNDNFKPNGRIKIPCFMSSYAMKSVNKLISSLSAEFIISLAEKHPTFDCFKAALLKNGADFTVSPKEIRFISEC